jgi:hypothetical protein
MEEFRHFKEQTRMSDDKNKGSDHCQNHTRKASVNSAKDQARRFSQLQLGRRKKTADAGDLQRLLIIKHQLTDLIS